MRFDSSLVALYCICGVLGLAPKGPWDAFNYAPVSRTVYPKSVYRVEGTVSGQNNLVSGNGTATIRGKGSTLTLDFGLEVGGLIPLNFNSVNTTSSIALTFSESSSYVRPLLSDDSAFPSANQSWDGALHVSAPLPVGYWVQPSISLRGGFRYLTITSTSSSENAVVAFSNVSCSISFMPHWPNLRAYTGYFYAQDPVFHDPDFLTKVWYAGAYTVQTNTVPLNTGRQNPAPPAGVWQNNARLGVAGPIIVDGAKRDRAVWPGDMGIAVPAQFVSTFDLIPTRNALATMFAAQNPSTGALPESGPPLSQKDSDTYHAWSLIGTHNYYMYTEDKTWLQTIWTNYTKAVAFLEKKVDPGTGLMNVTGLRDWARLGGGGFNAEGNALLYKVLTTASDLATFMTLPTLAYAWARNASTLKTKFNDAFWVESTGMYRDNLTTTLSPQDANSFAVLYNLTKTTAQAQRISTGLQKNWNELGPVAPELPDTISPFISGFELQAHFESGNDARAMDLLRREWGYMLYTNLSVQSTLLEGFTANGSLMYRSYRGYNYDGAYTSHAHGWSAGPTSALTTYLLGLRITSPRGKTYVVDPHVGTGIPSAEGGFETALGWFGVKWKLDGSNGSVFRTGTKLSVNITAPAGTSGEFKVPFAGRVSTAADRGVGGRMVDSGGIVPLDAGVGEYDIVLEAV